MILVHVIGKVGVGKTHFIRQYGSSAPCFDIKSIYEKYDITPQDLQQPGVYSQFTSALAYTLDGFLQQFSDSSIIFIESSGLNKAINAFLVRLNPTLLYVQSHYSDSIENSRKYAKDLNPLIEQAITTQQIKPDVWYHGDTYDFTPEKPSFL